MATQQSRYSDAEMDALGRANRFGTEAGGGAAAIGFQGGQVDATTGNLRPGSEVDITKGTKPAEVIPPTPVPEPAPTPTPAPITPVTPPPAPTPAPAPAPQQAAPAPEPQQQLQSRALWNGVNWTTYEGAMGAAPNGMQIFIPQGMDPSRAFSLNHRTDVQERSQRERNTGGLVRTMPGGREEGGPIETPQQRIQAGMSPGYPSYDGGMVGNGRYDEDSVIARYAGGGHIALAGGEHVTRAPSVTPETRPVLEHINQTGRLPGYAGGGVIGEPPIPAGGPTPAPAGALPPGGPPAPGGAPMPPGGGGGSNPLTALIGRRLDALPPEQQTALASIPPQAMDALIAILPEAGELLQSFGSGPGPMPGGAPGGAGAPPHAAAMPPGAMPPANAPSAPGGMPRGEGMPVGGPPRPRQDYGEF